MDVIIPPTIGAAMGFITSEPIPLSQRIGTEAGEYSADRHQLGPKTLNRPFNGGLADILLGELCSRSRRLSRASCR